MPGFPVGGHKFQVRNYEKEFHKVHGTFPDQGSDPKYKTPRKKLDDTKKLCQLWNACIAM